MTPEPTDRCPACGVTYRAFRCGFAFGRTAKGSVAAPNGAKAGAWAAHLDACDAWSLDLVTFDPSSFGAPRMPVGASEGSGLRTVGFGRETLLAVAYADVDPVDDWGGDSDTEAEWSARMMEARRVLGGDFDRVTEAA